MHACAKKAYVCLCIIPYRRAFVQIFFRLSPANFHMRRKFCMKTAACTDPFLFIPHASFTVFWPAHSVRFRFILLQFSIGFSRFYMRQTILLQRNNIPPFHFFSHPPQKKGMSLGRSF